MNNILTINGGSSSLKCALFRADEELQLLFTLKVSNILKQPTLKITDNQGNLRVNDQLDLNDYPEQQHHLRSLEAILQWLRQQAPDDPVTAISHRVVHGGTQFSQPAVIDEQITEQLAELIPLAPLHQPYNLQLIRACRQLLPQLPQLACFDTMFHSGQAKVTCQYAIPRWLTAKGVRRYGFHGLSYEFIAQRLAAMKKSQAKTIVAHLGAGASMCAMEAGMSIATTMGFSAAEGLPMASRTGSIDPGVLLYLMQSESMDSQQIEHLIYAESGWYGVSGISTDMQTLINSEQPEAAEAIELFCYRAGREIGSLTAALQGVEQIVFTGGIGENSAAIREKILSYCRWLGVSIDSSANRHNDCIISTADSQIQVLVIATDEESILASHCQQWLEGDSQTPHV